MISIARSRIGTGRSKFAVSRERCVSPILSAAFSMARHMSAIGGPPCWWSGCHGPRVNELGRYESPSNLAYALEGLNSAIIIRFSLITPKVPLRDLPPALHLAGHGLPRVDARRFQLPQIPITAWARQTD